MDTDANAWMRDRIDPELVLLNVETAADVIERSDFYCWVQGIFQSVLAHQGLICGLARPDSSRLSFTWMGGYPISAQCFAEISDPSGGVCHELVRSWEQRGRVPLVVGDEADVDALPEAAGLMAQLRRAQLVNCLAHGVPGPDGRPAAFFELFNLPSGPGARERRMLELLLPHLYAGWVRAIAREANQGQPSAGPVAGVLSAREVEVLRLVGQGETNKQIAERLGLTSKTVETHLERICRKLKVRGRVQAAVKATELNLTQGHGPGWRHYC
jgi:transcriptional regulator EpsA